MHRSVTLNHLIHCACDMGLVSALTASKNWPTQLAEVPQCASLQNTCATLRRPRLSRPIRLHQTSAFWHGSPRPRCNRSSRRSTGSPPTTRCRSRDCRSSQERRGSVRSRESEGQELQSLKIQAVRQGRAVGAVIGFFLKLRPYPMLEEIRKKAKLFQPAFGPMLVVEGNTVRDVLERNQEFTVDPYGVEMMKVMTPAHNGGFNTFVLSTDDNAAYEPDKRLLSTVCNREDADQDHRHHSPRLHATCGRRAGGGARDRLIDDRRRAVDCALRARHARPQVPWRSGRAATVAPSSSRRRC